VKRAIVMAVAATLLVTGTAWSAPAPAPQPRAQRLTKEIRDYELKLKTERDPAERQRLLETVETNKHEIGPYDTTGARLRCQAMWHDTAIDTLETEIRRLTTRPKPAGSAALAMDARVAARQMALLGLLRGWSYGGTLPRYQFDALGQYLTNNLPLLDDLFDSTALWLGREDAPMAPGPDRDAMLKALADAKDGIGRMARSVDAFKNADTKTPGGREAMMKTLPEFVDGLRAVYEADLALRALGEKKKPGGAGPPSPPAATPAAPAGTAAPSPAPAAEPTYPTPDQRAALETISAVAAALQGDAWAPTRTALEKFAPVAEQGLQVPSARPGAQEMLNHLARTADFLQAILKSKAIYPEYIAAKQSALTNAVEYLRQKPYRQYAYSRLKGVYTSGREWRILDASPLTPEACQGILRATGIRYTAFTGPRADYHHSECMRSLDAIITTLNRMHTWPPKDLKAELAPIYTKCSEIFVQAAEAFGKSPQDNPDLLHDKVVAVANLARDMERVIQADQAVKAVAQYMPARAAQMYADLLKTLEGLPGCRTGRNWTSSCRRS